MTHTRVRRPAALALSAAVAVGVLSACNDPRDDAPKLEVAWTSSVTGWDGDGLRPSVATKELWIFVDGSQNMAAVRLSDGKQAWSQPGPVCALSQVNDAGLLAMQTGAGCATITVVDTTTGETVWTKPERAPADDALPDGLDWGLSVGLSEKTASVATRCGVERWEAASGRFLGRLKAKGHQGYCGDQATTGTLAITAGRDGLTAYDVDSGKRVWSRTGDGAAASRIYSTDPLVMDVALDDVRAVRSVDPSTGAFGPVLGRTLPRIGKSPAFSAVVDGTLIGSYDRPIGEMDGSYQEALHGFDVATGKETWSDVGEGEDYLGADATGTYLGREIDLDDDGGYAYWVQRRNPGGSSFRTLGWIPDQVLQQVRVGNLLITGGDFGRPTVAYRLPQHTQDIPAPAVKDSHVRPRWAEGDIRPDPTVDPCAGVGAQALRSLGFRRLADQPAPLDCRWTEGQHTFSAQVTVNTPGDESAGAAARKQVEQARSLGGFTRIRGLGDEAWLSETRVIGTARESYDPGRSGFVATLLVRRRNVVAQLSFGEGPSSVQVSSRIQKLPPSPSRAEDGLRAAAVDVLRAARAGDTDVARAGADGPTTTLPDLCDSIGRDVHRLLPKAKLADTTAVGEKRLRGCGWRNGEYGSFVQVTGYAAEPSALRGDSATATARAAYESSLPADAVLPARRRHWEEGRISADVGGWHLIVRSGNVVLVVQLSLEYSDARRVDLSIPAGSRLVQRIAEDELAAIHG